MKRFLQWAAVATLVTGLPGTAAAFNPGTDSRARDVAEVVTNAGRICEGGPDDGQTCSDNAGEECTAPGTCTGIANVVVVARGLLTLVADTDLANPATPDPSGWDELATTQGCSEPAEFTISDCEGTPRSTFALTLEFTLNGTRHFFAEIFKDLPDNFIITPAGYVGWTQNAVESVLAERTKDSTLPEQVVRIRWGILPPAAEQAVGIVVGKQANQRVVLSRTDEVSICEDPVACNHGVQNPQFSDHAGATDVLGTARRFKVDIGLVTDPGP